jgi:hypothetical protein
VAASNVPQLLLLSSCQQLRQLFSASGYSVPELASIIDNAHWTYKELKSLASCECVLLDSEGFDSRYFRIMRHLAEANPNMPTIIISDKVFKRRDFLQTYCLRIGLKNVKVIRDCQELRVLTAPDSLS